MCPSAGDNLIWWLDDEATNWDLDSANEARTDYAQANLWTDESGTPLTDSSSPAIEDTNDWNRQVPGQGIDTSGYLESGGAGCVNEGTQCVLLVDPSSPPGARSPRPRLERAFGDAMSEKPTAEPSGVDTGLPTVLRFHTPRPNPARGRVFLRLDVPVERQGPAEVAIYNAAGRRVRTLFAGTVEAGSYALVWDGRDGRGRTVGSGVYFARMEVGPERSVHRIVVLH